MARGTFRRNRMKRFDGRAVFVTGGAHGIGRATVHRLAQEDASITVADIDVEMAHHVASEVIAEGGAACAIHCDVTDPKSVDTAIASSVERFGQLDALVHTAGGDTEEPPFHEAPDDLWHRMIDFNLTGTVRC